MGCAQQHAGGLRAPGMPGHGNPAEVEAAPKPRNGGFDRRDFVQSPRQVTFPEPPELRAARIVLRKTQQAGIEMRRLDHGEAPPGPVIDERAIGMERLAVAMREKDDRQVRPLYGGGDAQVQVLAPTGHRDADRREGQDGSRPSVCVSDMGNLCMKGWPNQQGSAI